MLPYPNAFVYKKHLKYQNVKIHLLLLFVVVINQIFCISTILTFSCKICKTFHETLLFDWRFIFKKLIFLSTCRAEKENKNQLKKYLFVIIGVLLQTWITRFIGFEPNICEMFKSVSLRWLYLTDENIW